MKKILICIDYQYDFVAPDGLLTCGDPAQSIYDSVLERVKEYLDNGHTVLFTHDAHEPDKWSRHPESAAFPIHCEVDAKGFELYGELSDIEKTSENVIRTNKKAYCMSFEMLNKIVSEYDEIELCGVTTDICVLQNAVGLYTAAVNSDSNVKLFINEKCCASFNNAGHSYAIEYMTKTLGLIHI